MKYRIMILLLGAMAASPAAQAVEPLSTAELVSHCKHYYNKQATEDRIFCVRYIQGFIDGAVATDERVARNIVNEYEKEETFGQRAARTRIGSRLERYGSSVYADFCLGDPVPLKEVVEHLVADSQEETWLEASPLARDLVYRSLREHYPCVVTD
jgi:hypothetical protein